METVGNAVDGHDYKGQLQAWLSGACFLAKQFCGEDGHDHIPAVQVMFPAVVDTMSKTLTGLTNQQCASVWRMLEQSLKEYR